MFHANFALMSMPTIQRTMRVLAGLAVAFIWLRALQLYPTLPERFPLHFDGRGVPDAWADTTLLAWCALPIVATVMALSLGLVGGYIRRLARNKPEQLNIPYKTRFLQLDPDTRVRCMAPTVTYLHFVLVLTVLLFLHIVEGSAAVATGAAERLGSGAMLIFLGLVLGGIPVLLWATKRMLDRV